MGGRHFSLISSLPTLWIVVAVVIVLIVVVLLMV